MSLFFFSFSADPGPSRPAATEDSAGVCKGEKRSSAVSRLSVCESVCVGASDSDRKVDVTR